jgi:hypothetical protein
VRPAGTFPVFGLNVLRNAFRHVAASSQKDRESHHSFEKDRQGRHRAQQDGDNQKPPFARNAITEYLRSAHGSCRLCRMHLRSQESFRCPECPEHRRHPNPGRSRCLHGARCIIEDFPACQGAMSLSDGVYASNVWRLPVSAVCIQRLRVCHPDSA